MNIALRVGCFGDAGRIPGPLPQHLRLVAAVADAGINGRTEADADQTDKDKECIF